MAALLSEHLEKGRIVFRMEGEDGEKWGYIVEPEAVVVFGENVHDARNFFGKKGKELYIRTLEEAIEFHRKKMEALKKELEFQKGLP
jgi:hypothetical protein